MRDWKEEKLVDFIKGDEESKALFGDFIKDKLEKASLEYDVEEVAEKIIRKVDEGIVADMDYSDISLEALEKIIDNAFKDDENPDSNLIDDLTFDLGAYLGMTIINSLGGNWRFRSDFIHSSVYFPSIDAECFPFHRVARRLLYGRNESLVEFYESLLRLLGIED